ncbi:MAG: hypothetical protein V4563_09250 [Pseudomonadota bacterium]
MEMVFKTTRIGAEATDLSGMHFIYDELVKSQEIMLVSQRF